MLHTCAGFAAFLVATVTITLSPKTYSEPKTHQTSYRNNEARAIDATFSDGRRTTLTTPTVIQIPSKSSTIQWPVKTQDVTKPSARHDDTIDALGLDGITLRMGSKRNIETAPKDTTMIYSTRKDWMYWKRKYIMRSAADENTGRRRADLASIEGCSSPASRNNCRMRNARYAAELVVAVDTTAKANVLANSLRSVFVFGAIF